MHYPELRSPFERQNYAIRLQRSQSGVLSESQIPPHPYRFALGTAIYNQTGDVSRDEELLTHADDQRTHIRWDFTPDRNRIIPPQKVLVTKSPD